jgi:hypothetical protein
MQNLRMLLEHWGLYAPNASMLKQRLAVRTTLLFLLLSFTGASVQAQIGVRLLEEHDTNDDAFAYTTGTYTPRAGSVLLAVVTNSSGTANNADSYAQPTSATGNGLTWTRMNSVLFASNNRRLTIFRAYTGNNVTQGSFTVNFPGEGNGQRRRSATIQIIELVGVEVTGTNGSDAFAAVNTATGTNSTATVTVGGAIDFAGTGMMGIFATNDNDFEGQEENGWDMLSNVDISSENLSAGISYALNTYDNSARMTDMTGNWAAIGIRLAPAEYYFNFPVVSTSAASTNQNYNISSNGITSRNGNASGLQLNMSIAAATFVNKGGTLTFSNVNFSSGSSFIADQSSTTNFPAHSQLNNNSNLFVANGATLNVAGAFSVNGGGHLRIYGTVVINGNLTVNGDSKLFIGGTGRLVVNGTFTMNGQSMTLVNGGEFRSTEMVTRGGASFEMAQGAAVETSVYEENNQPNVMRMGPGAGCFGLFGPNGRLNTQNNGFQPITEDATLKVCLPSNGVNVGNSFNSTNKGNANVTMGCTACAFLLGTTTLPITLNSFDGTMLSNGMSQLVWSVANNDEVAGFTVEYSTDGSSFSTVGNLKKGASSSYSFQHKSSHNGLIFYRLYMTDKMGKSTYSRTVSMLNGKQNSSRIIAVKPTVTSSTVRIEMYAATTQQITYSIADAAGRILMNNKQTVQTGMAQVSVDVSRMPAGILYLQIQTQDGQRSVQKLMKQ